MESENRSDSPKPDRPAPAWQGRWAFVVIIIVVALISVAVTALLVNIFERKREAKNPYLLTVELTEETTDPAKWGIAFPREYERYKLTVDQTHTRYGGSEAMTSQKLERDPWLKTMFAGYAFSLDYRDRRGHAYMLADQEETERVTQRPQPGACLHCHASVMPTYRRLGDGDVQKGFEIVSAMPYAQANAELYKTGDGTPEHDSSPHKEGDAHPVSCVDCHDPKTMNLRVTRPGFINGIKAMKATQGIPDYDPNRDATRQEMRSFVCGQCHVEYYCGPKETLFFPWNNGLKLEEIEAYYDQRKFPDGTPFHDWTHQITGAPMYKAQHPEFEMWAQGIHARSGVACADCHMPYQRVGAMKVSDHWIRSPLLMVNQSCQPCHRYSEQELLARVHNIQDKTREQINRAAAALVDMIDAIALAKANGIGEAELKSALDLHRKAQWRLDYVYAENSMGFHASQETMRILADAADYARQGQLEAQKLLMRPTTQPATAPATVEGVTPTERAPIHIAPGVPPPGR